MTQPKQTSLVIIGGDVSINYLIQRYTESMGYLADVLFTPVSAELVCGLQPAGVVFLSVENLEDSQSLVAGLANCEIPIIVCSSAADQIRTRELGADYCFLHPLIYDDFCEILGAVVANRQPGDAEIKGVVDVLNPQIIA